MRTAFLVTCEHGGNRIPARYRARFRSLRFPNRKAVRVLGWKPGVYGELVRGAR